jgi:hypothetical protein
MTGAMIIDVASGDPLTIDNDATGKVAIVWRDGGSNKYVVGASGRIKGTTATDLGFFAETGMGMTFMVNGSVSDVMTINTAGNVGIGETASNNLLHVKASDTGIAPHVSAQIVLEREGTNYLQFLTAENGTSGILFGDGSDVDVSKIYVDHNTTKMTFVNETSETMTLNGSKVGIGTTSPAAACILDVRGNINVTADDARILVEEADGTDIAYLGDLTGAGVGGLFLYNHGGTATTQLRSDANVSFINNGANFGIGTASPSTPLHVTYVGNPSGGNRNTVEDVLTLEATGYYPYSGYGIGINFQGEDYGNTAIRDYGKIQAVMDGNASQTSAGDAGFSSGLSFWTNTGGASSTVSTEKMRIDSRGNMSLGFGVPDTHHTDLRVIQLSSGGSSVFGGATTYRNVGLAQNAYLKTDGNWGYVGADYAALMQAYDGEIHMQVVASGSADATITWIDAITVKSDGNVGIGTASPNAPLTVAGEVYFKTTIANNEENRFYFEVGGSGNNGILHIYDNAAAEKIRLNTGGDSYFNGGNVGIGTTPDTLLTLYPSSNTTETIHLCGHDYGNAYGTKMYTQNKNEAGTTSSFYTTNKVTSSINGRSDVQQHLSHVGQVASNDYQYWNSGGSETMRIVGGDLGIGTTSPQQKLHIFQAEGGVGAKHATIRLGGYGTTGVEIAAYRETGNSNDQGIVFFTNSAASGSVERFRIRGVNGRLSYNGSSAANAHATFCGEVGASFKAIAFEHTNGGGEVGTIVTSSSSTSYNTSSDYRLKENVDYTWDATTRLKQLKPARFNWISDNTNTLLEGFLAHEVSSIVPEAVSGGKDAMTDPTLYIEGDELPEGKSIGDIKIASAPDHQGIDQSKLVPLLVKTIQELEARLTAGGL